MHTRTFYGLILELELILLTGQGKMGISNALGANTMNILLSLGMPWFIKTLTTINHETSYIDIESGSLEYTILALLLVISVLYLILYLNKFKLSRRTGFITLIIYSCFISLAIVADLVLFERDCNVSS